MTWQWISWNKSLIKKLFVFLTVNLLLCLWIWECFVFLPHYRAVKQPLRLGIQWFAGFPVPIFSCNNSIAGQWCLQNLPHCRHKSFQKLPSFIHEVYLYLGSLYPSLLICDQQNVRPYSFVLLYFISHCYSHRNKSLLEMTFYSLLQYKPGVCTTCVPSQLNRYELTWLQILTCRMMVLTGIRHSQTVKCNVIFCRDLLLVLNMALAELPNFSLQL